MKRKPYDEAYKYLFSSPRIACQLLHSFVEIPLMKKIMPEDLTLIDKSFISRRLKKREADIIYQVKIRTSQDDTVTTLYKRIMDEGVNLVRRLIADADQNSIPRRPQPKNTGSYFSSTTEDDFELDWTWPADKIRHFITWK